MNDVVYRSLRLHSAWRKPYTQHLPGALLARRGDTSRLDVGSACLAKLFRRLARGGLNGGGRGLFLLLFGLLALLLLDVAATTGISHQPRGTAESQNAGIRAYFNDTKPSIARYKKFHCICLLEFGDNTKLQIMMLREKT